MDASIDNGSNKRKFSMSKIRNIAAKASTNDL